MQTVELEQTLVLIKPDALKNSLTGYVLSLLSEFHTGLRFAGAKIVRVHRMLAEEHYAEHRGKVFFPGLIDFIMGLLQYPDEPWKRRVVALVYQGPDAVAKLRNIVGPTNPHEAREKRPGSIRSLGTIVPILDANGAVIGQRMENLIHASANPADAEREIKLWFQPSDIPPSMQAYPTEVSDDHYYYAKGALQTTYTKGGFCIVAPGNVVWKTDADALRLLVQRKPAAVSLDTIIAKYLINIGEGKE
ncbi:MAG: nucleoside-diphosphate kinase [Dehalococcoidia bacterium]|nr:MAG: nucleoside-diphosphate kinase [Dehalococcoidia bacterium]